MTSTPATAIVPSIVEDALRDAIAPFPTDLQDSLKEKFAAYFVNPETVHVEQVVQKRMTDGHAQRLLFTPTKEHAALYVLLVQGPPKGAPETHPCFIVCQRYLAMWYLCHARHWSLAREFILHGGLNSLVDLFTHENLHFRGQALDVFTQITSNPDFDWFQAPTCAETKSLHGKMLLLTNTSDFIQALVANKDVTAMSLYALQILAFYMSWVRKLYTKGELRLSAALLATLSDWKTSAESDEERELATNVFEDFNRWPAADAPSADKPSSTESAFAGVEYPEGTLYLKQALDALVVSDYDQAVSFATAFLRDSHYAPSPDRVQALGLRGRARLLRHLDRADLKKAVDDTSAALDMLDQVAMTQGDRDAGLLSRVDLMQDKATVLAQHLNLFRPALSALTPDEDTRLSADDLAILDAKRAEVTALWTAYNELHGQKHAKEQAIFDAILHRRGLDANATEASSTLMPPPSHPTLKEQDNQACHDELLKQGDKVAPSTPVVQGASNQATNHDVIAVAPADAIAPTRSQPSSDVRKNKKAPPSAPRAPTKSTSSIAPVARKMLKCKHNPDTMAALLQSMPAAEIAAAASSILNPDVLRGLLQGACRLDPKFAIEIIHALHSLPSLSLVLELADPDVVAAMTSLTLHE